MRAQASRNGAFRETNYVKLLFYSDGVSLKRDPASDRLLPLKADSSPFTPYKHSEHSFDYNKVKNDYSLHHFAAELCLNKSTAK